MTRKQWLPILALALLGVASCGGLDVGQTEQALAAYYSIGNSSAVATTLGSQIKFMSKEATVPRQPFGMQSAASSWSDTWNVDNGGLFVPGPDGVNGSGDLNRIQFYIYRVNQGENDYYVATVNITYTDGVGGGILRANALWVTAAPEYHIDMIYSYDNLQLIVKNQLGVIQSDSGLYAFVFPAGVMPKKAYSPRMMVGLDTSQQYGGCMRDIPDYDAFLDDTGHYREHNMFGSSIPNFPAYVSAPTSNPKCSLATVHYPANGYDVIQWHVDGV